ncbi:phage baseplate assembly protein V [Jatrophihabitans sp. DSM 45814]
MSGPTLLAPVITVDGELLADRWMVNIMSVRVDRGLGLVGRATLRFADPGYGLAASSTFALGATVGIAVHAGDSLIAATVTGVSLEQGSSEQPELIVTADDVAYKLTRGSTNRTYLKQTYSDVARSIFQTAGITATVDAGGSTVHEYLLQTGTDLAFIDTLAERNGFVWWVEGTTINFRPAGTSTATVSKTMADQLIEFGVHASGLRPTKAIVSGWNVDRQEALVGQQEGATSSAGNLSDFAGGSRTSKLGTAVVMTPAPHPADHSDADLMASSMMNDWTAGSVIARGTCDVDPAIKPSVTLTVQSAGPASGDYLITRVEHTYTARGFQSRFTAGGNRPSGLVDTLNPVQDSAGFDFPGLAIGVVTDINDPDSSGRVKVKLVGLAADSQAIGSPWARLVTLGGGPKRGAVFQPEVNDEVLVGFEHGDTRRPVVLGGLYSKKNVLPTWEVKNGQVQARRITSRLGHIVELSDGDDPAAKHVLLQLAGGSHRLRLGEDRFDVELASGKPIKIMAGEASFEITEQGDINIVANNISLKAKAKLDLEGASQATVKSNGTAAVQGTQVQVKADATAEVNGGGQLALKGGMVAIN